MSRRLAIFLVGGIGGGIASQGFPAIVGVTEALAQELDVDVFSLVTPNAGFQPVQYGISSAAPWLARPGLTKLRWPSLASAFLSAHRRRPYDALLSFWGYPMGTFAVALAALVRRPALVTLLGAETAAVPSIGYGHLRRPLTRALTLATCARASVVTVVSEHQREALRRHGLRRRDVELVPLGVDPTRFAFARRSFCPPLKLLHVANLTEVKDQATLIRGFAQLRQHVDARLRVVGPDYLHGQVQRLAADLGVAPHVEFTGGIPHSLIPSQLAWADMIVLTSLSEGQNIALTEAAMSGVLQVSTPVGHIADLGDEIAVVTRIGDPADFAEKIRAIIADPAEWERKVLRARAWAESHDLRWTVRRFTDLISGAIAAAQGRR